MPESNFAVDFSSCSRSDILAMPSLMLDSQKVQAQQDIAMPSDIDDDHLELVTPLPCSQKHLWTAVR